MMCGPTRLVVPAAAHARHRLFAPKSPADSNVMADRIARIPTDPRGRKQALPSPLGARLEKLPAQRERTSGMSLRNHYRAARLALHRARVRGGDPALSRSADRAPSSLWLDPW